MALIRETRERLPQATPMARPSGSLRFDWLVTLTCCWLVGGLYLDGWAHNHFASLETFFTPWHAVLYSGYAAIGVVLVITFVASLNHGHAWRDALPPGYLVSLAGVALFGIAGVLDMLWHIAFGIERSTDALLSPTHLLLAGSGVLMIGGPLRAVWMRVTPPALLTWRNGAPAVISLTLILAVLAFFTQFAHPFVDNWASINTPVVGDPQVQQDLGIASVLLQTALLMGAVLFLLRHWGWALPPGTLTFMLFLTTTLISFQNDQHPFILLALVVGVLADVLLRVLRPSTERVGPLRVFAFAVPFALYGLYFASMRIHDGGIAWSVHLWVGSAFMAGVVGLLLSYLAVPPKLEA